MDDRDPKGPSVGAHGNGEAVEVLGEWSPDGRRRYARISWTAGLVLVLISGTALLGWTVDFELFKHVLPGQSPMPPMTAVGLLLAGTALMLRGKRAPWRVVAGSICAAVVASLGAVFLVVYLFQMDVVVDQLLFPRRLAAYVDDYPGRPSEIASLGMLVAGLWLFLQGGSGRWSQLIGRVAGGVVLVVSLPLLIGNSGGQAHLQRSSPGSVSLGRRFARPRYARSYSTVDEKIMVLAALPPGPEPSLASRA